MTQSFKLITDSTCDLPKDLIAELKLDILDLSCELDGKSYLDSELVPKDFYAQMRNGAVAKTSQLTPDVAKKLLEPIVKDGNDILYIAFSSGLSGTYHSVVLASEELMQEYPGRKIIVIDSLSASLGEGLLVLKTIEKMKEGLSIEELADWVEKTKFHVCHVFTVDDLKYLHRGGRVSTAATIAGSLLGIKPVLHVDNEGHLIPISKVRGRKQSLDALLKLMEDGSKGYENKLITICHGDCINDVEYVEGRIKQIFGDDTRIIHYYTGPVIGAHSGPGTLAIFYMGEKR